MSATTSSKYFRWATIEGTLVFAKLVSLTQTFDSLGSINASRHVASRKEQAPGAGEKREQGYGVSRRRNRRMEGGRSKERCNNSYKLRDASLHPRAFTSRVFYRGRRKPLGGRIRKRLDCPRNGVEVVFRTVATKNGRASPFTDVQRPRIH